jgi:hypothetical protein
MPSRIIESGTAMCPIAADSRVGAGGSTVATTASAPGKSAAAVSIAVVLPPEPS